MFHEITIIDIYPLSEPNIHTKLLKKVGNEINKACKNVGFFYVINHEISESHLNNLILSIQKFLLKNPKKYPFSRILNKKKYIKGTWGV